MEIAIIWNCAHYQKTAMAPLMDGLIHNVFIYQTILNACEINITIETVKYSLSIQYGDRSELKVLRIVIQDQVVQLKLSSAISSSNVSLSQCPFCIGGEIWN